MREEQYRAQLAIESPLISGIVGYVALAPQSQKFVGLIHDAPSGLHPGIAVVPGVTSDVLLRTVEWVEFLRQPGGIHSQ